MKEILKKWTIKDAIFSVREAWAYLPPTMFKSSWAKILEQELVQETFQDVEPESFLKIPKLFRISSTLIEMTWNWLECDMDQEVFEQLTETEIADLHIKDKSSNSEQIDCRKESDDNKDLLIIPETKEMKHNQALEATEVLLHYFGQENANYSRNDIIKVI